MKYLRICILSVLVISTFLIITAGTKSASEKSTNSAIPVIKDIILPNNLLTGKKIFDNYCIACHGSSGKGDGPEAYQLEIKPTDFTSGLYKFKSTPYGTLPTEEDIVNTLKLGVRTTAMLPQLQLNDEQMHNVAEYILRFSPKNEKTGIPITIPASPERTNTLISFKDTLSGLYVHPNGTLTSTETFQTYEEWGGANGVNIVGLTEGQVYKISVRAKNGDGKMTAWSDVENGIPIKGPAPQLNVSLGVDIISGNGQVKGAFTKESLLKLQTPIRNDLMTIIENVQSLFSILLGALVVILGTALLTMYNALSKTRVIDRKVRLVPKILQKEASVVFGEYSQKNPNGTYEYSFAQHKRLHKLSRASLFSDRKSTRLNSSHTDISRMPSSA